MAHLTIQNVVVRGIAACVPKNVEDNMEYPYLPLEERQEYIESTGVRFRHCTTPDICTSDLCEASAERLLQDLKWNKEDIDALIFVSGTPDYKMPATACVLQEKMQLPNTCLAFDISLGCSGYVYGLATIAGMMQTGNIKKALLLVGNTQYKNANPRDIGAYFILGDAGSATALEYDAKAEPLLFSLYTFGYGKDTLIIPDGGCRNPVTPESFIEHEDETGNVRSALNFRMDGGDVFAFVMKYVVNCFKDFSEHFNITDDKVDYYMLHHASRMSCNKVHKKMHLPDDKVPYIFYDYGNCSNACVPLLLVTKIREQLLNQQKHLYISGFGTGLSVGLGYLPCNNIVVPELIQI